MRVVSRDRRTVRISGLEARHMRRALELAQRGWGLVAPNPMVGAVIVRDGQVVGEGHHTGYGKAHAEVEALQVAGSQASGSTLYVTLEPCTHEGKTPPCTEAIIAAGVRRVVVACRDPGHQSGGGVEQLRAAGLEVQVGLEEDPATRVNAAFLWSQRNDTPFTALKLALSLDAKLSAKQGTRSRVTGEPASAWVHRLRAGYDGILVGRRTATVDDPLLTVRGSIRPRRPPTRIVLDPSLRLSPASRLVRSAGEAPLWIATARPDPVRRRALEGAGARVLEAPRLGEHELDLPALWKTLRGEGIHSLMVEGGGRVASSVIESGCVQRVHLFYAPLLLGSEGVPAFPSAKLDESWTTLSIERFGADVLVVLEPASSAAKNGD